MENKFNLKYTNLKSVSSRVDKKFNVAGRTRTRQGTWSHQDCVLRSYKGPCVKMVVCPTVVLRCS